MTDSPLPDAMQLSDKEVAAAQSDGAKQAVADNAAATYTAQTDGSLPGDVDGAMRWHGSDESQPWAFYLDGSLDAIKDAYKAGSIPDNKLYGLLALERNGQNRTDYVKYMMKTLGLKAEELPGGGPSYTNDTTNVTAL